MNKYIALVWVLMHMVYMSFNFEEENDGKPGDHQSYTKRNKKLSLRPSSLLNRSLSGNASIFLSIENIPLPGK